MTKKKRSSPKIEEYLSPTSSEDQKKNPKIIQRSDADHSQIIGGDADTDHSQIIGGDAVKLLGGYISPILPSPPPPRVLAPLTAAAIVGRTICSKFKNNVCSRSRFERV